MSSKTLLLFCFLYLIQHASLPSAAFQTTISNETSSICFQNRIQNGSLSVGCAENLLHSDETQTVPDANLQKFTLKDVLNVVPRLNDALPTGSRNAMCAKHSKLTIQGANQFELWALKMLDSSGKMPPSMLKGNIDQFGDFDQCLNSYHGIHENDSFQEEIYGKYCLAAIDFTLPPSLNQMDRLLHSHYAMRSKPTDPNCRVPRLSGMYWAVCIPDSCSAKDVEQMIITHLKPLDTVAGLKKEISADEFMCYTKSKPTPFSLGTKLTIALFLGVIGFTLLATAIDNDGDGKKQGKLKVQDILIQSFSLKRTLKSLMDTSEPADDVACLHGIRALNALALLFSHKCLQLLIHPYVNRTEMVEFASRSWSMVGRSGILYTDSFLLISGCLAAQNFLKLFERKRGKILNNFISRFLRLTPNLAAIILFCTFILPLLNSGPLWNNLIMQPVELCKQNWWKNILYIHNYFGFEKMCLSHTHQLGTDMQLYIFSPVLVYLLWRTPALGIAVSILLASISTYLRYYVTLKYNISPIGYFGVSISELFNTANFSYILPTHRATVYIFGVLLGYYLHYRSRIPIKLSYVQVQLGTFSATILGFLAIYAPHNMANEYYEYDSRQNAEYMAFLPLFWSAALIWGILINVNNYTGTVGSMFRWKGFRVFTRIAYAVYLVQLPVYFYNVGASKYPKYFTSQALFNFEEYAIIIILSAVLTILFDLPFHNISKLVKSNSFRIMSPSLANNKIEKKVE